VTWTLVLTLAAVAYAFKALGSIVIGSCRLPAPVERCLALVPAALLSALIVTNTFTTGQQLVLDARAGGVAVAAAAAWRRAPFPIVIGLGAATTALLRRVV
jgi:branched chain amino acid efflux pump